MSGTEVPITGLPKVAQLGVLDYVILVGMLVISSGIGLYFRFTGGKQSTMKEYMLADNNMSIYPVAFSLMASFMSAITLLGLVQEMYMYGTMFIMINFAYIIATPIVCYFYLPVFFRLQKTSVYEYLEMRFGYATRLCASISFTLQMTLYMGIVLFAPALALSAVTGLDPSWCIVVVGSVCTFYSALGGIKAVLITDVMQSLLMFSAVAIVLITGLTRFSVSEVFQIANDSGRLQFFVLDPNPQTRTTLWTQLVGGCFTYLSLYGVNQAQVQRLLTISTLRKSQTAVWIQWPILMVLSLSTCFAGLIIYAHYKDCDPLLSNIIENSDQLLPLYVVQFASGIPGLTGLFVAGVFSGSLSTVSSSLNSLSAVTVSDYLQPLLEHLRPGKKIALPAYLAPIISVVYGVLCIGIAFLTSVLGSSVLQASLTVFGAVGGPLLGLFTLAMTTRVANQKGALTGLILGLLISLLIGFGQPKPAPIYMPRSTEGCYLNDSTTEAYDGMTTTAEGVAEAIAAAATGVVNLVIGGGDAGPTSLLSSSAAASLVKEDHVIITTPRADLFAASSTLAGSSDIPEGEEPFNFLHEIYAISYGWIGTIGFLITYSFGLILSLMCGGRAQAGKVRSILLANCCGGTEEDTDNSKTELHHPSEGYWEPTQDGDRTDEQHAAVKKHDTIVTNGKDCISTEITQF